MAVPVDRLLGQVINHFAAQLRALAADPYDDQLIEAFCEFLTASQKRMARAEQRYRSAACPSALEPLSLNLNLYHCLSLVKDALADLERYSMGYVDSYLRDGCEQIRRARIRRDKLQSQRPRLWPLA